MQVDPVKPNLKLPGTQRLKLKCDEPLSNIAFKFKLRRYTVDRMLADVANPHEQMLGNLNYRFAQKAEKPLTRACSGGGSARTGGRPGNMAEWLPPALVDAEKKLGVQWASEGFTKSEVGGMADQMDSPRYSPNFKLSVGSGIEFLVSNPARPIRSVHFGNLTDRPAGSPTWSRSLSK